MVIKIHFVRDLVLKDNIIYVESKNAFTKLVFTKVSTFLNYSRIVLYY